MFGHFLSVIRDTKNRKAFSWLGGWLVTVVAGAWVVVTYFFPSDVGKESAHPAVQAEGSSIASGRDTKIGGGVSLGGEASDQRE